jgi:hypothetical protein
MKKVFLTTILILSLLTMMFALGSCADPAENAETQTAESAEQTENQASESNKDTEEANTEVPQGDEEAIDMTVKINDEIVQVKWENNESVKALMKMASENPVVVDMSMYGGFEQVGSLGTTLPSNDQSTKTKPGDIVLYTSDCIVVFYGNNSWAYTRLGHIENKSKSELQDMLGRGNVTLTITAE